MIYLIAKQNQENVARATVKRKNMKKFIIPNSHTIFFLGCNMQFLFREISQLFLMCIFRLAGTLTTKFELC